MSPLRKRAGAKPILTTAYEWLNANIQPISWAITATTFAQNPALQKKHGERGRLKCGEDNLYHLHYLAEALINDSPKMFVDYIGWAKIMLGSRGIDPAGLGENLKAMAHVLELKSPPSCRKIFTRLINSATAQLPNLPETLPSFIDPGKPLADLANSYLTSLLLLNREEATSLVLSKLASDLTIRDIFHHVIYPVQQEVGRLWQENRITVLQEHYCTAATDLLITRIKRGFIGVPRAVTALALCPDGEEHSLGIKMFSDLLESDGWKSVFIGPKCPTADVLKYLQAHATDLIAISVTTPLSFAKTRQLTGEIKSLLLEHAPLIIVGGAALNSGPDVWKYLGADAVASDSSEGVEIANQLAARRKDSGAPVTGT